MAVIEPVTPDIVEIRKLVSSAIDHVSKELRELNKHIHSHPELGYEEHDAHDTLTAFLEARGFSVKRHAYGLDTSFEAEVGSGGRLVVFCAEYDALPGIGHACGHNLIATASMTGFIGLAAAVQRFGVPGRVRILGTPAEEGGGGKVKLIEEGAFKDNISAAIMAHPLGLHAFKNGFKGLAGLKLIASHKIRVEFTGKSAHAGGEPWNGVNALDAVVAAYNAISMLRQQIQPDERIHGVIESGGTVPNVITDYARVNYYIRSPTIQRGDALLARVKACFDAAAIATGCKLNYIPAPTYMDLRANDTLSQYYVEEMASLGEKFQFMEETPSTASTDMGNVSYTVPSFHGGFGIPAPAEVSMHNPLFAAAAGTDEAHDVTIKCGQGMALLGWRVLTDKAIAESALYDFKNKP